jgi:hypothetical protein
MVPFERKGRSAEWHQNEYSALTAKMLRCYGSRNSRQTTADDTHLTSGVWWCDAFSISRIARHNCSAALDGGVGRGWIKGARRLPDAEQLDMLELIAGKDVRSETSVKLVRIRR